MNETITYRVASSAAFLLQLSISDNTLIFQNPFNVQTLKVQKFSLRILKTVTEFTRTFALVAISSNLSRYFKRFYCNIARTYKFIRRIT